MNKANSDRSFVSLSQIFTIFSILVNNDIVDMLHDFVAMETILAGYDVLP